MIDLHEKSQAILNHRETQTKDHLGRPGHSGELAVTICAALTAAAERLGPSRRAKRAASILGAE